jgi:hypothetical protein
MPGSDGNIENSTQKRSGRAGSSTRDGEQVSARSYDCSVSVGHVRDGNHLGDEWVIGRAHWIYERPRGTLHPSNQNVSKASGGYFAREFCGEVEVEDSGSEAGVIVSVRHDARILLPAGRAARSSVWVRKNSTRPSR